MYVFISHSTRDKQFVRQLADSLALYAIPLFLDERDIRVGDSIPKSLYEALDSASHCVVVISKHSSSSRWVEEELSVAKVRQLSEAGCVILPVLIDRSPVPASLRHVKYADFRRWRAKEAYYSGLQQLTHSLGVVPREVVNAI